MKLTHIIRSKGTFTDPKTNKEIPYDNVLLYYADGQELYTNESVLVGITQTKPYMAKVKYEDFVKVAPNELKTLIGKDVHLYTENGKLVKLEIE